MCTREVALGYPAGSTGAPGISDAVRHEITGRAMDAYCMQFLLAVCSALAQAGFGPTQPILRVCPPVDQSLRCTNLGGGTSLRPPLTTTSSPVAGLSQVAAADVIGPVMEQMDSSPMPVLMTYACVAVAGQGEGAGDDIWEDHDTLKYLQEGILPEDRGTRRRVAKRAAQYRWVGGELKKVLFNGTLRVVPPPDQRQALIKATHEQCGHFGRKRTTYLLCTSFWWKGVAEDVGTFVRNCEACDRVKATFNAKHPQLHPLPIQGLMYRWGVDLLGELHKTRSGNVYIMVMIEHFSKWVELAALPAKESYYTAAAFLDKVISRFGAPAEVVTDRGTEFEGAFEDMLQKCMIDHRTTSASHPQADGLAERAVQTLKRALRKLSVEKGHLDDWDLDMHWIAMGYRCSVQEATGFSPYALVYGVTPVIPPAIRERVNPPLSFSNVEAAAEALRQRGQSMKRACATAAHNLTIAQHRDTLRYAKVRSGGYNPKLFRFVVGDYVYLRQANDKYTLDAKAQPAILRVRKVNHDGTLVLQGKCGRTTTVQSSACAPCHLQVIDGRVDHTRARPSAHMPCEVCGMPDQDRVLLLCDGCGKGWHTFCLQPPLSEVPVGAFFCPVCVGRATGTAQEPQGAAKNSLEAVHEVVTGLTLSKEETKEVQDCKALHGRVKVLHALNSATGKPVVLYGTLTFLGEEALPKCLQVQYNDGTTRRLTSRAAKQGLQAPGFTVPDDDREGTTPRTRLTAAAAQVAQQYRYPDRWELHDSSDMMKVLRRLQPGKWPPTHCTRLLNSRPGTAAYVEQTKAANAGRGQAERIRLLQRVVNLRMASSLVDPWGDMLPEGACVWAELGLGVLRNAAKATAGFELQGDAFQPGWYQEVAGKKVLGTVVSMPWVRNLDVAVPLAVAYASEAVCMEVPIAWLANAPPPRAAWLEGFREQGRLLCIMGSMGLPATTTAVQWLCIFRHEWIRKKMVRAAYAECKDMCFVF